MYKLTLPFDSKILSEIKTHLISKWPEEAGGIVVNNTYVPCENASEDRTAVFKIDPATYMECYSIGRIQAIIHSHDNWEHASEADMIGQMATGVPWGIVSIKEGKVDTMFFWGDSMEPADLIGRPFHHGVYDCYALVRDYYRIHKDIILKNIPREYGWWKTDPPGNVLMENMEIAGFVEIDYKDLQPDDCLLFSMKKGLVNHSAVYLGGDEMLHHVCSSGVISRKESMIRWKRLLKHCIRYVGGSNE